MTKYFVNYALLITVLIFILVSCGDETGSIANTAPYEPHGFPIMHLHSELCPFDIYRNQWHSGTISIEGATDTENFAGVQVELRGRGNSTWVLGPEKRPLRLRFDQPRSMLGSLHEAEDWILLANHFDMSLLRNYAAFYLANQLDGQEWSPFSQFVHLYVNGEYFGVYQLTDERDVGEGRARLVYDSNPARSEFFFELDGPSEGRYSPGNELGIDYFVTNGMAYDVRFPRRRDRNGHVEYMQDFMGRVNEAAFARDFAAIEAVLDLPSFIDYYLIVELFKNIDIANFSLFMQIRGQGAERRLYHGPVWDFDRSAGNTAYWTIPEYIFAAQYNYLFYELLAVPEIFDMVTERWNEIADREVQQLVSRIRYMARVYAADFQRNFQRHSYIFETNRTIAASGMENGAETHELPEWYSMIPEAKQKIYTHQEQVEYLASWLEARAAWLTKHFNGYIQ